MRRPFDAELVMVHVVGLNVGDVQVHCGGHKFKCQPIKRQTFCLCVQRNAEITTADTLMIILTRQNRMDSAVQSYKYLQQINSGVTTSAVESK